MARQSWASRHTIAGKNRAVHELARCSDDAGAAHDRAIRSVDDLDARSEDARWVLQFDEIEVSASNQ